MIMRPVADVEAAAQCERECAHRGGCALRVGERQANAAHPVAEAIQTRRISQMYEREPAIELVHSRLEEPDDAETTHARHDSGGGRGALGRDQNDRVADLGPKFPRERGAENDAVLPGGKVRQPSRGDVLRKAGGTALRLRQYAADARTADALTVRQHGLLIDIGYRGEDTRLTHRCVARRTPVG